MEAERKLAADLRQEAADLRATASESPYDLHWYGEAKARVREHMATQIERRLSEDQANVRSEAT